VDPPLLSTNSAISARTITGAEYFVDTDPGVGNAVALAPLDGAFDAVSELTEASSIIASMLPEGSHRLALRFRDSCGRWGNLIFQDVTVAESAHLVPDPPLISSNSVAALRTISAAQYAVDGGPGIPLVAKDGTFDSAAEDVADFALGVESLSPGSHRFALRFQSSDGSWGNDEYLDVNVTDSGQLAVDPPLSETNQPPKTLVAAEYFLENDPGPGQATPVAAQDGSFDSTTEMIAELNLNPALLNENGGRIGLRFRDSTGQWGSTLIANVQVYSFDSELPQITTQPLTQSACDSSSVEMFVTASGTDPLAYQWRYGGSPVPDATNSVLYLNSISGPQFGDYDVIVSNNLGSVTSVVATVSSACPVFITVAPASQAVVVGNPAIFNVAATGDGPLSYQWRKNGVVIGDATNASYGIPSVLTPDAGHYDVVVANSFSSVTSSVAVLAVNKALATVTLSNLDQIYSGTARMVSAMTVPAGMAVNLAYNGSPSPPTNAGSYTVIGTLVDPNYYGSTTNTLSVSKAEALIAVDNLNQIHDGTPKCAQVATVPPGLSVSLTYNGSPLCPSAVGTYAVIAAVNDINYQGVATNALVIQPVLPFITQHPQSKTIQVGSDVSFAVAAGGTFPLAYQWQLDGTNILNATNTTLVVSNASQNDLGAYTAVVLNNYGSITSSVANIFMYPYIAVPFAGVVTYWGQSNALAVVAGGSGTLFYQWFKDGVAVPDGTNSTLIFSEIQFTNAGMYSIVVSSSLGTATNAAHQVIVNPANVSLKLCPDVVIQGTVGYRYIIQSTRDLGNTNSWMTETNITLTQPIQYWDDINTDTATGTRKFYRVLPGL
jgi:hypothetical protein